MYFYCLNQLGAGPSDTSSKSEKQRNSSLLFSSGVACRAVAAIVVQPLTVIKTRFEAGDRGYGKTGEWVVHGKGPRSAVKHSFGCFGADFLMRLSLLASLRMHLRTLVHSSPPPSLPGLL